MAIGWTRGKCLGKGGYGEVFVAIPRNPNFPKMAVKSAPEDSAASLAIELQILEQFRGVPGVIQCFGAEIRQSHLTGGRPRTYNLLLEYASRGSLADLIGGRSRQGGAAGLPESHVKVYTRMILQALSSIHARGFTHCDIKPDNILVFPPSDENRGGKGLYELKVADFGLAMETWNLSPGSENYRGTTRYMPPEMVLYGDVSPAMDIWALGCTVVEMMTGELPWSEWNEEGEVVREISKGPPEIPDWVSEQGKDFLRMCFARSSCHRQNVDMFLRHRFLAADYDVVIGSGRKKTASSKTMVNGGVGAIFRQKQRSPVCAAPYALRPRRELFQQGRPAVLMC